MLVQMAGRGVVFPNSAVANALGRPCHPAPVAVSVGDVEVSVGAQRLMRGEESYRLASDRFAKFMPLSVLL